MHANDRQDLVELEGVRSRADRPNRAQGHVQADDGASFVSVVQEWAHLRELLSVQERERLQRDEDVPNPPNISLDPATFPTRDICPGAGTIGALSTA